MTRNPITSRQLRRLSSFILAFVAAASCLHAQCSLSCSQGLQVSLDNSGQALITPLMISPNAGNSCPGNLTVTLYNQFGQVLPNPITCNQIGQTVTARVKHTASGNSCNGTLEVFDALPPVLSQCTDKFVFCHEDPSPANLGYPVATDNCTPSGQLNTNFVDIETSLPCGTVQNGMQVLKRIDRQWTVSDDHGNSNTCLQRVWLKHITLADITFPPNLDNISSPALACGQDPEDLAMTGQPTANGVPIDASPECEMGVTFSDQLIQHCAPGGFTVLRNWTAIDFCSGTFSNRIQIIRVEDSQAPTLLAPAPFEVGTDGFLCSGTVLIPVATATDNCSSVTVTPSWEFGSGFGPFYGIPEGQHLITYTAEDACGNQSTATTMVTVLDNTPPQAICSADLQVALSASGLGLVQATTIDAGSFDNCSPVFLSISRDGVEFQPQIQVNCQDQGSPLLLTLRVLDASGLENFCETEVNVRDFLKPTLVCPPNLSLNCLQDYNDTGLTGQASGSDNCALQSITYQDISNIQACNIGSLTRWWTATDAAGNTKSCSQLISVEVVNGATVAFPQDVLLQSCAQPTDLEPLATGQPIIGGQMCSPLSVNYTDQVFNAPAPSCYRIFRHWKVIDHCVYNPNGGSAGIWEHTQLIDVQDQTAPQLVLPSDITMQADPATQQAVVNVPDVEALDCSAIQLLQHNSAFASNPLNASGAYPVGEHWITFSAMDACGNQAQQTLFIKVTPAYVPDPVWQVGGQLRNESGIPVRNVPVMLFADGFYAETSADTNGVFGFDDVPDSLDYTLQPFNNANWRNGVTTYDLVLISKHILGLEPLNSPFRMLAADANLSGSITTFDILQLRKLILGITDSLPNNQSWRFVRSGYVFPDSLNPFTNPVPEQIYLPALHQQQFGQDFTGIKIGDVNGSSNPAEARELRDTLYLTCEDQQVHAGQVLEVPIVMGGWAQADGFQFGLSVNPAQFELLNPIFEQPQLLNETHVNRTGTQVLRFSWNQSYGSATPKQDTLFKLQLRAKTNGNLVGGVTLDHNDMAAEAYTPAGDFALGLRVKTTPDVALPQPLKLFPNPSTGVFFIQNPHPGQEMDCRVYNQLGQLVWEQSGNTAELIQVVLSTQDSQLYQVECSSRERTYSGKVLVQQL